MIEIRDILKGPDWEGTLNLGLFFRGELLEGGPPDWKPYKYKRLETEEDFDVIMDRELKARKEKDTPQFREHLISKIKTWRGGYLRWQKDARNNDFLNTVDSFIQYVENGSTRNVVFKKIFKSEYWNRIDDFVDMLRENNQVIDIHDNWIGPKYAATAFYNVLLNHGILSTSGLTIKEIALVFSSRFENLGDDFLSNGSRGLKYYEYEKDYKISVIDVLKKY